MKKKKNNKKKTLLILNKILKIKSRNTFLLSCKEKSKVHFFLLRDSAHSKMKNWLALVL